MSLKAMHKEGISRKKKKRILVAIKNSRKQTQNLFPQVHQNT
jgi:hypothetical protein